MDQRDKITQTGSQITGIEVSLERIEAIFKQLNELAREVDDEAQVFRYGAMFGFLVARIDQVAGLISKRHEQLNWLEAEIAEVNSFLMADTVLDDSMDLDEISDIFSAYVCEVRDVLVQAREQIAGLSEDGTLITNDQLHSWLNADASGSKS